MSDIRWVNFIHIYQPAWQDSSVLTRVTKESYEFLLAMLEQFPSFHVTFNIAGSLLELLEKSNPAIIKRFVRCLEAGQIELTGSAQYHAFLPNLPENEIRRQIILQEQVLARYFNGFRPTGFFFPEMAYSPRVGMIIKEMGYTWTILDPISTETKIDLSKKYISRRSGLAVVFRNRTLSKSYPPEELYKLLQENWSGIIVTATDGELYGHFHQDWQDHLKKILESGHIQSVKVSDYLAGLKETVPLSLRSASWETKSHHVRSNNPFTIWLNRSNLIHRKLWQLANFAITSVDATPHDSNFSWARHHLDRGLSSCSWWWASGVKTSVFGPLAWNPEEVQKGALELIKSIRSLHSLPKQDKIKAEKIFASLIEALWKQHWEHHGN